MNGSSSPSVIGRDGICLDSEPASLTSTHGDPGFTGRLRACRSLEHGRRIHAELRESRRDREIFLSNLLIQMYGRCGSLVEASAVFDSMQQRNVFSWTLLIAAHAQNGRHSDAVDIFWKMDSANVVPDEFTCSTVLGACSKLGCLEQGKAVHARVVASGADFDITVQNALVNMYAKCKSLDDAWAVFLKMSKRDVVSWNGIIAAFVYHGQCLEALVVYRKMQLEGVMPNLVTLLSILTACSNEGLLVQGKAVHERATSMGLDSSMNLQNSVINMYGKCNSLVDARQVFEGMVVRDSSSWSCLIGAYAQHGYGRQALELFHRMDLEGTEVHVFTFISVFSACANTGALDSARAIHERFLTTGFKPDVVTGTALLNMFGKCQSIEDAKHVFDSMKVKNRVTWNAMMGAYVQTGDDQAALDLYEEMDVEPDVFTFSTQLSACSNLHALEDGKRIHQQSSSNKKLAGDLVLQNALLNMYSKCGSLPDVCAVFQSMKRRDVVSWNAAIGAHVLNEDFEGALKLFKLMNVKPDAITFAGVLTACSNLEEISEGREVHRRIREAGLETVTMVRNALVTMYAKCGSLEEAMNMFWKNEKNDVVTWSSVIATHVRHGHNLEAIQFYRRMNLEGAEPDLFTFAGVLGAFGSPELLNAGKNVHLQLVSQGFETDTVVCTALINMYCKCGDLATARKNFDGLRSRNVVSWNAMISGYVQSGSNEEALLLYESMEREAKPDEFTFASVLTACSSLGDVSTGCKVHEQVTLGGFENDLIVQNALVDMYGKCGNLAEARYEFEKMKTRSVISWTAMITAYARHGYGAETLELVSLMNLEGIEADGITFLSILQACSHSGLVDEAGDLYSSMLRDHRGSEPMVEHAQCFTDILARAGWLKEVEDYYLNNIDSFQDKAVAWTSLLSACKLHKDAEIGARAASKLRDLHPDESSSYVMFSSIIL